MNISLLLKVITKYVMLFTVLFIFFMANSIAQNFPQPIFPENNSVVFSDAPILKWLAADNVINYNLNIYKCTYDTATNFSSLKLNEFVLSQEFSYNAPTECSALAVKNGNLIVLNSDNEFLPNSQLMILDQNFNILNIFDNFLNGASDFEGLTHILDNYFMIAVENTGEIIFTEISNNSISLINGFSLTEGSGQTGFEGISINPINNSAFILTEKSPKKLFTFNLPTAPTFTENILLTEPFDLENQLAALSVTDVSGLFHLAKDLFLTGTNTANNFLVLSDESQLIIEMNASGDIISTLDIGDNGANNTLANGVFQAEGIAFVDGNIFVVSESDLSDTTYFYRFENPNYQKPTANFLDTIIQDVMVNSTQFQIATNVLLANTKYCWEVEALLLDGTISEKQVQCFTMEDINSIGCTDALACNYNANAIVDDGNCNPVDCSGNCNGSFTGNHLPFLPCNDADSCTSNDTFDENCFCIGNAINGCNPIENTIQHIFNITNVNDDAEENQSGSVSLNDLEINFDNKNTIGLRFPNINLPQFPITNAYLTFTSASNRNGNFNLTIKSELNENPASFAGTNNELSQKTTTTNTVFWNAAISWQTDNTYQTNDLSSIVNETINQSNWQNGNAIVFIIEASNKRDIYTLDQDPTKAVSLTIETQYCVNAGTACDDGLTNTTNDTLNLYCNCVGVLPLDSDNDGIGDDVDICPNFDDNLLGIACNDNDICTENDIYQNCECVGVLSVDSDDDNVCDNLDQCPNFDNNLIGTACDDNNLCTTGDIWLSNCTCKGISIDFIIHNPANYYTTSVYQANNYISSSLIVLSGDSLNYLAGDYIELLNDFETKIGSNFSATIENCQ